MNSAYINNLKFSFKENPHNKKPSVEIKFTGSNFTIPEDDNVLNTKLCAEFACITPKNSDTITNIAYYIDPKDIDNEYRNLSYIPVSLDNNENTNPAFFTSDSVNGIFNGGLDCFWCPGFEKIYIKCRKTGNSTDAEVSFRFEFYLENPYTTQEEEITNYFALSTSKVKYKTNEDGINEPLMFYSPINTTNYDTIGYFVFNTSIGDELYLMNNEDVKYFKFEITENLAWKESTLYFKDLTQDGIFEEDLYNCYPIKNGKVSGVNYWDFAESTDVESNTCGKYCLRVKLIDTNNNNETPYQSTIITCHNGRYEINELAHFSPCFKYNIEEEKKDGKENEYYCTTDQPDFSLIVPTKESESGSESEFELDFYSLMDKVIYYKYAETVNEIDEIDTWESFPSSNGKTIFDVIVAFKGGNGLGGKVLDGEKTIVLQISDGVGNKSKIIEYSDEASADEWIKDSIRKVYLYREIPNSIVFNVLGSSGSEYYTGMIKDEKTGKFVASNKITVNVYAKDNLNLPLKYKLYLGNSSEKAEWRNFDANVESTRCNIPFYLDSESDFGIFENNHSVSVNLIFKNSAGLKTNPLTKNIFFNTTILKTDKDNLRENSNSYKPVIEYYNGDEYVQIHEMENFDELIPKRSWHEIFYPTTHSYPIDSNGNIDVEEALKITDGNKYYDAVKTEIIKSKDDKNKDIEIKRIVYDDEQRPITIWNDYDEEKKYPSLQSNNKTYNSETGETEGLAYWIIDNTGYTDFQLEFEHFHLDQTSHIQLNNLSPFSGDCLVVYDASDKGATSEYIDQYGRKAYKLIDSTKLKMLAAYTGSGINTVQIYPENDVRSVNANSNGGFTTDKFISTNRICLIFYSDGGEGDNKSGFKIKASPARETNWINWETDNKRGEVWLHKIDRELLEGNTFETLTTKAGYCPDDVRMSYQYSETSFDIDYENGSITFHNKPEGQVWGTFCYYNYNVEDGPYKEVIIKKEDGTETTKTEEITKTFVLADDDLVDYRELSIYVSNNDENGKNIIDKNNIYDYSEGGYGKIVTNITTYKDSGLIKFEPNNKGEIIIPKNRMFADYYCHSFYRLTDDGYGNLYFYDDIIVPDRTENYPDFTYVDLKVVNEGEATLRNGKIKFTFRGIATGSNATTITSVLNPDRPWDVQKGTPEETFDQVGGVSSSHYNFPEMTWNNALAIFKGSVDVGDDETNRTTLIGGTKEIPFVSNLDMKQEIYLRVVWTMFKDGSQDNPNYINPTSAGEKCFSGEIEGSFYTIQI